MKKLLLPVIRAVFESRRFRKCSAFSGVLVLVLMSSIYAEKELYSKTKLQKLSTHVIVGKVRAIYRREETSGDWKVTRYLAEVHVDKIEKGEGVKESGLVYVRYWKKKWIGDGLAPPSTSGHAFLPSNGDTTRIYLARNSYDGFTKKNNDGGFNVIGVNGFESIKKAPKKKP